MTRKFNEDMAAIWDGKLNETMQPVVREYEWDDFTDVLYMLLLEAAMDSECDPSAFVSRAAPLRPDRLGDALCSCNLLIVATAPGTDHIMGFGGVSRSTSRNDEYWHISFLSTLNHENSEPIIRKLLFELEGWSFSSLQCPGLTIDAPGRMRPLLACRGYSTIALSPDGDIATMAKQSDPEAYQNVPMSFLDYFPADANDTEW